MSPDEVRTKKVTFSTGLPRGTCATFTHEGERWIAYPQEKSRAVAAVVDQLLTSISMIHDDLLRWVNTHPEDAKRAMQMVARTLRAKELAKEKVQAWTQ